MPEFDKHPHIRYTNLDHLYWGEYAYRVSIEVPLSQRQRCRKSASVRRLRDAILDEIEHDMDVVYRMKAFGFNFFFSDPVEAERFIDDNAEKIDEVVRPLSLGDIDVLRDRRVRLRESLYYGKFRWCVTFGGNPWFMQCMTTQEVDDFIAQTFSERDPTTYRYKHRKHSPRKLYLRDDADVVLVRLSIEEANISAIEQVKLREELE